MWIKFVTQDVKFLPTAIQNERIATKSRREKYQNRCLCSENLGSLKNPCSKNKRVFEKIENLGSQNRLLNIFASFRQCHQSYTRNEGGGTSFALLPLLGYQHLMHHAHKFVSPIISKYISYFLLSFFLTTHKKKKILTINLFIFSPLQFYFLRENGEKSAFRNSQQYAMYQMTLSLVQIQPCTLSLNINDRSGTWALNVF